MANKIFEILTEEDLASIRATLRALILRNFNELLEGLNINFVYNKSEMAAALNNYGINFILPPENFAQFLLADKLVENNKIIMVGIEVPYWSDIGITDVYQSFVVDVSELPHKIYVKGHKIP